MYVSQESHGRINIGLGAVTAVLVGELRLYRGSTEI